MAGFRSFVSRIQGAAGSALKILFTGASSFTGCWLVGALVAAGHRVTATFRGHAASYEGLRAERIGLLAPEVEKQFGISFGEPRFLELVSGEAWDVVCHHGAEVANYRSLDFDVHSATKSNTSGAKEVVKALRDRRALAFVLTGSVFEPHEGLGDSPMRAFSPYGLSKGLTAEIFSFWGDFYSVPVMKFVIPNPFGPYEDPRFCHFLMATWARGERATVRTPDYVRDNIHVGLLSKVYARWLSTIPAGVAPRRLGPSGYVETQGAFARRFSDAMRSRIGLDCALTFEVQTDWSEPAVRINCDRVDMQITEWQEGKAWDEVADYYRKSLGKL